MASAHWQVSMLACILLYGCSAPSTVPPPTALAAKPSSAQEGSTTMPHPIKVTISVDRKVSTVPANNVPVAGFNSGDTVTWEFDLNVAESKLAVRPKDSLEPFKDFPGSNQISGRIFSNSPVGFEYEISMDGEDLKWVDGANGGCIKPIGG
jgi:hypothetical protein